jgi:hypothetical protein
MAFRFRRSVKLMPGVRVNVGKRGMSVSAGVRGASVTMGQRGVYGNVGLPGTGMSYRERLDTPLARQRGTAASNLPSARDTSSRLELSLALSDDGTVTFHDEFGQPLPARMVKRARDQNGAYIQGWLEEQCERWNQGIGVLIRSFGATPAPFRIPINSTVDYVEPYPQPLAQIRPGVFYRLWCAICRPAREKVDAENARRVAAYAEEVGEWTRAKSEHDAAEAARRRSFTAAMNGDPEAMQTYFEQRIQGIEFPWHSGVSFDILDNTLWIDLDLPEIEDLPTEQASVAARGVKINVKRRSDAQVRKEYMALVHSLAFRVAGEGFASLPTINEVVVSAYSQRADKTTGHINDEYLISARIPRKEWQRLNWESIGSVDPVEAFTRFDVIRSMTGTGIFRPISPHEPANA